MLSKLRKDHVFLTGSILLYLILASWNITFPGIHYDEIFYGNAALGPVDSDFVLFRIGKVPVLLMDYIGALKAWIYGPIFALFKVSAYTIRFPNIILSALGLVMLYFFIKTIFDKKTALLTIFLLSIDPIFIVHTRLDFGPVVLSFLLRIGALFVVIRFLKSKTTKDLLLTVGILLLGIFNKLDFVWFANALILSLIIYYRNTLRQYWNKLSPFAQKNTIIIGFLLSLFTLYLFLKTHYYKVIDFFYLSHLVTLIKNTFELLGGYLFYFNHLGENGSNIRYVYIAFAISCILYGIWISIKKQVKTTPILFVLSLMLIIFLQIMITNIAGASWHLFMMYPFITILLAYGLTSLFQTIKKPLFSVGLIGLIIAYNMHVNFLYLKSYYHPKSIFWSPAIYSLSEFTKRTQARFVSVDWGIHNQLQALDHEKGKYFDLWTTYITDPSDRKTIQYLLANYYRSSDPLYFILYPEGDASFKQPRKSFFRIISENKIKTEKVKEIKDGNRPVFELYKTL